MDKMVVKNGDIVIRKINDTQSDYKLLTKWLSDEEVLEFYQGRDKPSSLDDVIKKYGPRARGESYVNSCIIEFWGKGIGYIQYYPTQSDEKELCGYGEDELIYGIDLFIGEIQYQDKGIGTKIIKTLINYIETTKHPDRIIIDPRVNNKRAIRCYEKCGFVARKVLKDNELHEGVYCDNLLMEITYNNDETINEFKLNHKGTIKL